MPEQATVKRARRDKRQGKAASTQAGEFVREEMDHIREGKHGARSAKQAIAIGLSKARRAGVKLGRPPAGAKKRTKQSAKSATRSAKHPHKPSARRSRAASKALTREPHAAASKTALSRHAHAAANRRTASARSASARRAAKTRAKQRGK